MRASFEDTASMQVVDSATLRPIHRHLGPWWTRVDQGLGWLQLRF
jgi:hypothetical protein